MLGVPAAIRVALGGGVLIPLLIGEQARPLRRVTQPKCRRVVINVAFGGLGGAAVALIYGPLVIGPAEQARHAGIGVVRWLHLPAWASAFLAFVLLDYTLWIWHLLNHRVPLLWRFHAAHHVDLDLDASTALRFHPGELLLSVPFRALQVAVIGVDVPVLLAWEAALLVATEFHHSNLRLPLKLERVLRALFVTPRMHGIHHSIAPREVNSNFGTLLTAWDRLHRTFVHGVRQRDIVIGLAEYRDLDLLRFLNSLAFPFTSGLRPRPFVRNAAARGRDHRPGGAQHPSA
jgi:sterol desaturase/sphingolipid hydroxylase (fatty acid hydroxylase superfamily)